MPLTSRRKKSPNSIIDVGITFEPIFTDADGEGDLTLVAKEVPEPGTLIGLGMGLVAMSARIRRSRCC